MSRPEGYPDTEAGARANITQNANSEVRALMEREGVRWVPDPWVEHVWGLLDRDGLCLIISYNAEADFELSWAGELLI